MSKIDGKVIPQGVTEGGDVVTKDGIGVRSKASDGAGGGIWHGAQRRMVQKDAFLEFNKYK